MQVHALSYDLDERRWSARFPAGDSARTLVTVFGAPAFHDRSELFVEVARAYPRSLVVGCSTAGEIQGTNVRDRSLAVTVTRFDRTDLQLVSAELGSVGETERVGTDLGAQLAAKQGLRAVLVLCDGLAVNGAVLAKAIGGAVGPNVTVTGGLAADGMDFKQTWLTVGGALKRGAVAAVGFYGPSIVVGHGTSNDWVPQPSEWVITRCEGNYVFELDYQPAIEVYRNALADRADELPEVAIWFPLAVHVGAERPLVRTVIGIDEQEGALILAGEVRHGQSARLLNADLENLIEGAARAASGVARTGAPVSVDCLAIAISCFGRRKILGSWSDEELVSMREGLHAQRTTVTGFYAYGQIAPDDTGPAALHNQTLSLTVFSEARAVETAPARVARATPPPTTSGYTVRSTMFDARTDAWSTPLPDLDSPRTLVLAFGAPELGTEDRAIGALRQQYPSSIILGCSTAGEISGATVQDRTLVASITRFAKTDLRLVAVPSGENAYDAARRLAAQLNAHPGLQGVLVLADGLHVNGSELARGLNEVFAGTIPVAGGLAGDGVAFRETWVLAGPELGPRMIAAVGLYGAHVVVGYGSRGGWDRFGMKRTVTKATGNVLYELDGRPALHIYKEYLGDRATQLPAAGLSLPLAVRDPVTDAQLVRTPIAVDDLAGSITFSGDVPVGHLTQFMKADVERLINGATHAALMASENGPPASPEAMVIAISCAGRRNMLGAHTEEEVEAVGETFRSERVRVTGFYAYGELTPGADGRCELHNQAMSLLVVSEALAPIARPARAAAKLVDPLGAEAAVAVVPPAEPTVAVVAAPPTPPPPVPATAPVETRQTMTQPLPSSAVAVPDVEAEPRGPIVRTPRPNVGEVSVKESLDGDVRIIQIGGRITESFKGEAIARTMVGRVILDLGEIHRITSFGVREWLAMFSAATNMTECYFARCSEAVVNQLTMIRAFDGGARVLSFFAPYLCEGCNKPFERLFDFQVDHTEIGSMVPESVRCPRCNEPGRFDDDPRSYFAFFGDRSAPVSREIRAAHEHLCAQDQVRPAEEIEKIVDGEVTRVRLSGRLSLNVRWRRVFENIDGAIVVDLSAVTVIETSGLQSLDVHLRTMIAAGRPVAVEYAPLALLERLIQRPAAGMSITSVTVDAFCAGCGVARTATVRLDAYREDRLRGSIASCKRCDRRLDVKIDPIVDQFLVSTEISTKQVVAAVAVEQRDEAPSPVPRPNRRSVVIAGVVAAGLVVVAVAGWKLVGGGRPRKATIPSDAAVAAVVAVPDAGVAWQPVPDLPPGWADRAFTTDRESVYLVGESEAASIDAALPGAREHATTVLIRQLAEELAVTPVGQLAAIRVPDARVGPEALAMFDVQYGNLTTFERIDVATRPSGAGLHVFVRFKLPRISHDRILAAYRDTATFRGVTVALVFPTLAQALGTKPGLVVVDVQAGSSAETAKVAKGALLLRVGDAPVSSLAAFRAVTKRAWMQPDVRAKLTLEIEADGQARRAFVGLGGPRRGR